jgi:hypothetical protein
VTKLFAVGAPVGLLADGCRAAQRCGDHRGEPLARGVAARGRRVKEWLRLRPQRRARFAQLKASRCRLAHPFDEDVPVPAALATTAAPDFFQRLLEALGLIGALRGPAVAPRGHACNQRERFC